MTLTFFHVKEKQLEQQVLPWIRYVKMLTLINKNLLIQRLCHMITVEKLVIVKEVLYQIHQTVVYCHKHILGQDMYWSNEQNLVNQEQVHANCMAIMWQFLVLLLLSTGVTRLVYGALRSPWKIQIREKYGLNSKRCPFITLCVRTVPVEIPSVQ